MSASVPPSLPIPRYGKVSTSSSSTPLQIDAVITGVVYAHDLGPVLADLTTTQDILDCINWHMYEMLGLYHLQSPEHPAETSVHGIPKI